VIRCRSYAKINLYLDVLQRRPDGFHDIETVFQSVDLADELAFTETESGVSVACDAPGVPTDERNLAVRAALALREASGCRKGAYITLKKRIPAAAGLAGGSGNAAAALLALNRLWSLGRSAPELADLGARLGADVPFCMTGGTMAATGRGEHLEPVEAPRDLVYVLVHPNAAVSTAEVYGAPDLPRRSDPRPAGKTERFRKALAALAAGEFAHCVANSMETVVFQRRPELAPMKQRLLDAGCVAAAMSGSGPTLFGVCRDKTQALGVAAAAVAPATVARSAPCGVEFETD
jgi:4-diphosphocytidyl-2-C-methyl-D-erythritol kinase